MGVVNGAGRWSPNDATVKQENGGCMDEQKQHAQTTRDGGPKRRC
jgi:hypothetical protein